MSLRAQVKKQVEQLIPLQAKIPVSLYQRIKMLLKRDKTTIKALIEGACKEYIKDAEQEKSNILPRIKK